MNLDELVVSLTLDPTGFKKGAAEADTATSALKKNAISAAEAAHTAAQASAKAAQVAAKATQDYAQASTAAEKSVAKAAMDTARANAAAAALTAAQTKKAAQDAAGVLAKSVSDRANSEKKIREEQDKTAKASAKANKGAAEQLNSLKNQVLGLFAAYEAGKGLFSFVAGTTAAEQASGRLAARVGISTAELSAQENAAQLLGAKLGDVAQSYENIAQKKADFLVRGNLVNAEINLIAGGVKGVEAVDFGGDAKVVHEALQHNVHEIAQQRGGQFAQDYGQKAGLSQGEIDNAIANTDAIRAQAEARGKLNALNDHDVDGARARTAAGAELEQTATRLGQTLLTEATPAITEFEGALTGLLHDLQDWEKQNPDWSKPLGDFAKYIGSPEFKADIREFEGDLKVVATDVNDVAQAMGGWTRVGEGLIALKVGAWLLGIVGPLARLVGLMGGVPAAAGAMGTAMTALGPALVATGVVALGAEASKGTGEGVQTQVDATSAGQDFVNTPRQDAEQPGARNTLMNGLRHRWNQVSSLWNGGPAHLETYDEKKAEERTEAGASDKKTMPATKGQSASAAQTIAGNPQVATPAVPSPASSIKPTIDAVPGVPPASNAPSIAETTANPTASASEAITVVAPAPAAATSSSDRSVAPASRPTASAPAADVNVVQAAATDPFAGFDEDRSAPNTVYADRILVIGRSVEFPQGGQGSQSGALPLPSLALYGDTVSKATTAAQPQASGGAQISRGERNNNPLNLTYAGQEGATSDGRFAKFATAEQGIAAAGKQLLRYADHGINTISGIISKWAPGADGNDTKSYIASVAKSTGLDPNKPINTRDPATLAALTRAMAKIETGKWLDVAQFNRGAALAVNGGAGAPLSVNSTVAAATQPGAAVRLAQAGTTDNSQSIQSETHVGDVHIHTTTADPAGHAAEFNQKIRQYDPASDFNTAVT